MVAKQNKKMVCIAAVAVVLILTAWICRILGKAASGDLYGRNLGLVRSFIWLGLYIAWGISVRMRILQKQTRRYLTGIVFLIIFWFLIRTVKYFYISATDYPVIVRYLWYLYYLPMMFIPLLAAFIAMSAGKEENYRISGPAMLPFILTAVLFLLVMTNDLHQLVFIFPSNAVAWTDFDYDYGVGYYFVVAWLLILAFIMLVELFRKRRLGNNRRMILIPGTPILIFMGYVFLYYLQAGWLRFWFGDLTAVACLFYMVTMELFIQCRFIQSNINYRELFDASTVGGQITDEAYHVWLSSRNAKCADAKLLRQTENGSVMLEGGIRLSGAPVHGGHVIWSEDVSPLLKVLEELEETKENLEDANALLEEENKLKAWEVHIAEQNRLYRMTERDTAKQICRIDALIRQAEAADTEEEKRKILGKILVVGAYLKRRSNLVFLADRFPVLEAKELSFTIGESLDNLELCGVTCGFHSELTEPFLARTMMTMYDFFEEVTEQLMDSMDSLSVYVEKQGDIFSFVMNTDADSDITDFFFDGMASVRDEDGEWQFTLRLREGGVT